MDLHNKLSSLAKILYFSKLSKTKWENANRIFIGTFYVTEFVIFEALKHFS